MQQSLWQDGYVILQTDTGEIGRSRLKRFLQWLDKSGKAWTEPDLDAYSDYLENKRRLHPSTIYQNISGLKAHYLAILSDPDNYAHIDADQRPEFVNAILRELGFNPISINYETLMRRQDARSSENVKVLLPTNSYQYRDTQITAFVHWLDKTERHWTDPSLLDYKEYLMENTDMSINTINNAINAIRRRYHDVVEEGTALEELPEDVREGFLNDIRKRLGYYDQFPSRTHPVREMLEDDPYNQSYLTPHQVRSLLSKPDPETFVGMRDRALIALTLATGLQQFEIAGVEVDHLRQTYEGELALYVPESKQRDERYVPYEDYEWVLDWIDAWLEEGEISEKHVFRGTYGNRDVLRPHGIAPETASDILSRYPIPMYGTEIPLLFGDLRATCARRWYDNGHDLDEIERRLGTNYRRATLKLLGVRVRKVFGG